MVISIEKIVQEDPHIVAIHQPSYTHIPEVNVDLFLPETTQKVRKMSEIVRNYIGYPFIEDNFGICHTERRKWRKEMEEQYGEVFTSYYTKNKLRGSVYGYTINALRLMTINTLSEKREELTQRVINITHFFPHNYDLLEARVKIETMRTVEEKVYDFVQSIQVRKK